ncbi:hypothetical protein KP509_22G021600 [Ceratopteris richardii]|uniref:RING-type domain-containing protein n=1 Tax=Ceratopteris richardii TaxID=49495 RepID=A0A8T2S6H5_CERRI|nr:hypothetical protein KP509_22G021600 [Ceratopteris richardii]
MEQDGSVGVKVPSVAEGRGEYPHSEDTGASHSKLDIDKDIVCPICFETMKDAFSTACGHSFCYTCIMIHLNNKKNCPSCGFYLTNTQVFPNFLLNRLLRKASTCQLVSSATPLEQFKLYLQEGAEVSAKELDSLLSLLVEKKRKAEQEEAETNMEILLDFLQRLHQQKQEELKKLQADLEYIREDVTTVEKQKQELLRARERYSVKLNMLLQCSSPSLTNRASVSLSTGHACVMPVKTEPGMEPALPMSRTGDGKERPSHTAIKVKDRLVNDSKTSVSKILGPTPSPSMAIAKKKRVLAQFEDLQECYLRVRRKITSSPQPRELDLVSRKEKDSKERSIGSTGLEDFQSILNSFTRYSRLRVIAEVPQGDSSNCSNIVSSIEFSRDDNLFATAGVSRRIKIFEFSTVVNVLEEVHFPVAEMPTRSKLSCLSWNKSVKNQIASSDYEGIITVWDVNTRQSIMEYEEHEKRAWSVDFSRLDPSMLVSGSDDCKVKVWCTRQETSVLDIDMKANICCVKYNPGSSHHLAVGSADHHIHYYDLRNTLSPVHIFSGHRKAVSYVKFISSTELASASTDSTLRLWDVRENTHIRTFKGHTNEKNFVGLSVNSEYIACGSETNEVCVYHKAISRPAAWHKFGPTDLDDSDDEFSHFISAVCWKNESPTMLAANSAGTIKVLVLAP